MATRSLFDQLVDGFAGAVGDVRSKLIDEAWFGRSTAPDRDAVSVLVQHDPPESVFGQFVNAHRLEAMQEPEVDHDLAPSVDPERRPPSSWDQMCAEMAKARGYEIDHEKEHEIEHGRDL